MRISEKIQDLKLNNLERKVLNYREKLLCEWWLVSIVYMNKKIKIKTLLSDIFISLKLVLVRLRGTLLGSSTYYWLHRHMWIVDLSLTWTHFSCRLFDLQSRVFLHFTCEFYYILLFTYPWSLWLSFHALYCKLP